MLLAAWLLAVALSLGVVRGGVSAQGQSGYGYYGYPCVGYGYGYEIPVDDEEDVDADEEDVDAAQYAYGYARPRSILCPSRPSSLPQPDTPPAVLPAGELPATR